MLLERLISKVAGLETRFNVIGKNAVSEATEVSMTTVDAKIIDIGFSSSVILPHFDSVLSVLTKVIH